MGKGIVIGVVGLAIVGLIGGFIVLFSGVYNVAASVPHTPLGYWFFETAKVASVRAHSASIQAPVSFTQDQVLQGTANYGINCGMCHGAVGVDAAPFSKGMMPEPPKVTDIAAKWGPAQLFWIAKHGIKMTGMPATGSHLSDDQIWSIVAYIHSLAPKRDTGGTSP